MMNYIDVIIIVVVGFVGMIVGWKLCDIVSTDWWKEQYKKDIIFCANINRQLREELSETRAELVKERKNKRQARKT